MNSFVICLKIGKLSFHLCDTAKNIMKKLELKLTGEEIMKWD